MRSAVQRSGERCRLAGAHFIAAQTVLSIWNGAEDLELSAEDAFHSRELNNRERTWRLQGDWKLDTSTQGWVGTSFAETKVQTPKLKQHIRTDFVADNDLQAIRATEALGSHPATMTASIRNRRAARRPVQLLLRDNWENEPGVTRVKKDNPIGMQVESARVNDLVTSIVELGRHVDTPAKEALCLVANDDAAKPLRADNAVHLKHLKPRRQEG